MCWDLPEYCYILWTLQRAIKEITVQFNLASFQNHASDAFTFTEPTASKFSQNSQGGPRIPHFSVPELRQILTNFQNYFTVRVRRRKFVITLSLKILSHLKCVAALPCDLPEYCRSAEMTDIVCKLKLCNVNLHSNSNSGLRHVVNLHTCSDLRCFRLHFLCLLTSSLTSLAFA